MNKYKTKIKNKIESNYTSKLKRQDIQSATEFKKGLDKGKFEVGSLLFSGDVREEKIIKQVCSYLGYKLVHKDTLVCKHPEAFNLFNVVHYTVEML